MGDAIERALEETVPLLRSAQRYKLLRRQEITQIARTRRNHEYALASNRATRADFLKYASFERELAKIFKKRAKRLRRKDSKVLVIIGKTAARTNLVYSRAVKRFHGDADLWLHYAKHCIDTGAFRAATKVFTKALGKRPDSEKIWLAAISFLFDTRADTKGGRALAQRGLRTLPDSVVLWKEYFRMEVSFLAKLVSRRVSLGLPIAPDAKKNCTGETVEEELPIEKDDEESNKSNQNDEQEQSHANQIGMDLTVESDEDSEEEGAQSGEPPEEANQQLETSARTPTISFWHGGIPIITLRKAFQKVKLSPNDCADLWDTAASIPFTPVKFLTTLATALKEQFPDYITIPLIDVRLKWDLQYARYIFARSGALDEDGKIMREMDKEDADYNAQERNLVVLASDVLFQMREAVKSYKATNWDSTTRTAALRFVDHFKESVLRIRKSEGLIRNWKRVRARIAAKNPSSLEPIGSSGDGKGARGFKKFMDWNLFDYAEKFTSKNRQLADAQFVAFKAKMLIPFRTDEHDKILCIWVANENNLERVREVADSLIGLPPLTLNFLKVVIKAEMSHWKSLISKGGSEEGPQRAEVVRRTRLLFKKAIDLDGAKQDVDLWLDYVQLESGIAEDWTKASTVAWKATKTLHPKIVPIFEQRQSLHSLSQ